MRSTVTTPASEIISLKLGKYTIIRLRELAVKESIKQMRNITVSDLIKESLKNRYPTVLAE